MYSYFIFYLVLNEGSPYISYNETCNITRPGFYNIKNIPFHGQVRKFRDLPIVKREDGSIYISYGSDFKIKSMEERNVADIFCLKKFSSLNKANYVLNYTITMNNPEIRISMVAKEYNPQESSNILMMNMIHGGIRIKSFYGVKEMNITQYLDRLVVDTLKHDNSTTHQVYINTFVTTLDLELTIKVLDMAGFRKNKILISKKINSCQ
ncbi:unnamed protein product [Gordionus sp. m RMFG-2023]